jgi:hypothetical protein
VKEDVAKLGCRNWTAVALSREGWRKLFKEAQSGMYGGLRERERVAKVQFWLKYGGKDGYFT